LIFIGGVMVYGEKSKLPFVLVTHHLRVSLAIASNADFSASVSPGDHDPLRRSFTDMAFINVSSIGSV